MGDCFGDGGVAARIAFFGFAFERGGLWRGPSCSGAGGPASRQHAPASRAAACLCSGHASRNTLTPPHASPPSARALSLARPSQLYSLSM